MGAAQQRRALAASKFTWTPDDKGGVDQWYGFSMYYDSGLACSGVGCSRRSRVPSWHTPVAWRMDGDNGSLNFSGDMNMSNANGHVVREVLHPAHGAAAQHGAEQQGSLHRRRRVWTSWTWGRS